LPEAYKPTPRNIIGGEFPLDASLFGDGSDGTYTLRTLRHTSLKQFVDLTIENGGGLEPLGGGAYWGGTGGPGLVILCQGTLTIKNGGGIWANGYGAPSPPSGGYEGSDGSALGQLDFWRLVDSTVKDVLSGWLGNHPQGGAGGKSLLTLLSGGAAGSGDGGKGEDGLYGAGGGAGNGGAVGGRGGDGGKRFHKHLPQDIRQHARNRPTTLPLLGLCWRSGWKRP
jgi:hypothetical protein